MIRRENTATAVKCTTASVTKIVDQEGNPVKNTCQNQLLFEENFSSLDGKNKWTVREHFSSEPVRTAANMDIPLNSSEF